MAKKNLMPLLRHLDPRADNSFTYEKGAEVYKLVQTWHLRVHKVGDPADKYEIIYVRAGQKFDHEPTDDDFKRFAAESEAMLKRYCAKGEWAGGELADLPEQSEPFKFDKWFIKHFKEV